MTTELWWNIGFYAAGVVGGVGIGVTGCIWYLRTRARAAARRIIEQVSGLWMPRDVHFPETLGGIGDVTADGDTLRPMSPVARNFPVGAVECRDVKRKGVEASDGAARPESITPRPCPPIVRLAPLAKSELPPDFFKPTKSP